MGEVEAAVTSLVDDGIRMLGVVFLLVMFMLVVRAIEHARRHRRAERPRSRRLGARRWWQKTPEEE